MTIAYTIADLPLDVQGTSFRMRVWEELRRIPRGQTVSYGELAGRIGKPTANRAWRTPVRLIPWRSSLPATG